MDNQNPNRINPTSFVQTVPRQTPNNDFGQVLARTVTKVVSTGAGLVSAATGTPVVSAALAHVSGISGNPGAVQAMAQGQTVRPVGTSVHGIQSVGSGSSGLVTGTSPTVGTGATTGATGQGDSWDMLEAQRLLQEEGRSFNMAYVGLQNALQKESREFNALTNIMKVRHDSAKAAINNIR